MGDLISRRKLDGMRLATPDWMKLDQRTRGWNECITYIQNNAPAVDAELERHGRWVRHKPNGITWTLKCSECNWVDNRAMLGCKFNYCPSCGAKMRCNDETE